MNQKGSVAVIGAGIAGLAAAYRLQQRGWAATVYESRDRVGGRMWSLRKGDFLMDAGMSAYLGTYREAIRLIGEVGLLGQMSDIPAIGATMREGKRFHFDYGKPVRTAIGTGVLSWPSKLKALRLAIDTFRNRASLGYSDYTRLAAIDDETVAEYCRRALNTELHNYVGRPLVSGTWAADDDNTSAALLFWTIRNMLAPSVYNLNEGVMALPVALARHVTLRLNSSVEHVEMSAAGAAVTADGQTQQFDGAVIATTAEPALAMFPQMDANTRALYATVRYRKLGNIAIGYKTRPADPATYYLPTPHEDPDTVAVIADHNKAPHRAPADKSLFTVLLSHDYLEANVHRSDEDVLDYALDRASKYYGIAPAQAEAYNVVRWPESVPNLDRGRFRLIADYTARVDRRARVQFASDLDRIPGCNGALVSGEEAAARLADALEQRPH